MIKSCSMHRRIRLPGSRTGYALGTFRPGADVDLNVDLEVPITMGNDYQERIGALDWQFMAEEFPLDPGRPEHANGSERSEWT